MVLSELNSVWDSGTGVDDYDLGAMAGQDDAQPAPLETSTQNGDIVLFGHKGECSFLTAAWIRTPQISANLASVAWMRPAATRNVRSMISTPSSPSLRHAWVRSGPAMRSAAVCSRARTWKTVS